MRHRLVPAALLVLVASSVAGEEWSHVIAPYAWGPSLDGHVSAGSHEADTEASFSDLLENLELAGLVRYEGHGSRWGVLVDGMYMGLGQGFPKTDAEFDFDLSMLEVAGSYHATQRVEILFGARATNLVGDVESDVLPDARESDAWVDAIAGVRFKLPIGRRWRWTFRGDVGAGGSDDTWNVESGFAWDVTEDVALAMGWRVLAVDRESGVAGFDGTLSGPELGVAFRF